MKPIQEAFFPRNIHEGQTERTKTFPLRRYALDNARKIQSTYRGPGKRLVRGWEKFLPALAQLFCMARPCLGPAQQDLQNLLWALCTASGTRSVTEVLFIYFEKFLLQFLSCLSAQQLQHAPTAYGTFRITFDKTSRLTQCRSLYTSSLKDNELSQRS